MPERNVQEEKTKYSELIKTLIPINDLAPVFQNEVVNAGVIRAYKKKDFVFKQGDTDGLAFYLLEGQIELLSHNHVHSTISSGTDSARYALARLQPRQFSARAKANIMVLELETRLLDRLMVTDQQARAREEADKGIEISHIDEQDSADWMTRVLQSEWFSRLPTSSIQHLFAILEPVEYKAGAAVITQGDTGDFFYIIQQGRCEVLRAPKEGATPFKLAELHAGDSFGEEALLANATRNASVVMLTDGILMRLSKNDFITLIKKPLLGEMTYAEGMKLVKGGRATWLDVRYQNEYHESCLEGSKHIPLTVLRTEAASSLDKDRHYIVYCDTGGRSSAATFLLTNLGYHACYLKGGLASVPPDALQTSATPAQGPAPSTPPPPADEIEQQLLPDAMELDPGVRTSLIDANLAVTNMVLEDSWRRAERQDSPELRVKQKLLEQEKKKLEAEKRIVDDEARKQLEREQEKIRQMQEQAEKRLAMEKKKIEDVYARNTREMEKFQRLKEEAEARLRKEREKLEREMSEAQDKLHDAQRALEAQTAKVHAEQESRARELQARAKASIEENRRKLAEEIAQSNEELERVRQEKEVADAARKAAQEEAQRIIADARLKLDQERALLQQDRKRLEQESSRIQESMQEIEKSRKEAEAMRAVAQAEIQALRAKQRQHVADADLQRVVAEEIRAVETRMQQAEENLDQAHKAQVKATAARVVNARELEQQKEQEEKIRRQVEADLQLFEEEEERRTPPEEQTVAISEHAKLLKQRADAAKRKLQDANQSLLDDIASLLGEKNEKK